jgi:hypothetical protein
VSCDEGSENEGSGGGEKTMRLLRGLNGGCCRDCCCCCGGDRETGMRLGGSRVLLG